MHENPPQHLSDFSPPAMQPPPHWEPPAILLERSLVVHAQEGITGPDGLPMGWIGPLSGSGGGSMGGGCM